MYTQCPDCSVAFRVTAEVLKQAAGKVRCGGCGNAFNALEYLSEERPATKPAADSEPALPELTPDSPGGLEAGSPPTVISAEQSAALLKTLDQLAGEDIRIEDTGVEWRVLQDDEDEDEDDLDHAELEAAALEAAAAALAGDDDDAASVTSSMRFLLQDEDEDAPADIELNADVVAEPATEEMRFDDNTPLPEDFEFSSESEPVAPPEPQMPAASVVPPPDEAQVDLALGDPDEWEDLLGEFDEPVPVVEEAAEAEAEATEPDAEPEAEDVAATDDSGEADTLLSDTASDVAELEAQLALAQESLGVTVHDEPAEQDTGAEAEFDAEADSEPEAELDIESEFDAEPPIEVEEAAELAEQAESGREVEADAEADPEAERETEDGAEPEPSTDELADVESGIEAGDTSIEEDLIAAAFETEAAARLEQAELEETLAADDEALEEASADAVDDDGLPADFPVEIAEDEAPAEELADDLEFEEVPLDVETELAAKESAVREQLEEADESATELVVPEMSEEEKTINMMIDQELFAIAVEDDEGFASTIVQKQPGDDVEELTENQAEETAVEASGENPLVETIIMEGETVRGELDRERSAADREAIAIAMAANAEAEPEAARPRAGIGMIAAAIGLVVLLGLQYVHYSREALATVPAINDAIGPVYRALGMPVSPAWDITGWRFERTKSSMDETGERLTVYSEIGNASTSALPLPLVHISLTDRYQEVVGSSIMEPSDYLVDGADPRQMVASGEVFNAVIVIDSISADVTSFQLNVCYRLAGGQLKCEIEDFK